MHGLVPTRPLRRLGRRLAGRTTVAAFAFDDARAGDTTRGRATRTSVRSTRSRRGARPRQACRPSRMKVVATSGSEKRRSPSCNSATTGQRSRRRTRANVRTRAPTSVTNESKRRGGMRRSSVRQPLRWRGRTRSSRHRASVLRRASASSSPAPPRGPGGFTRMVVIPTTTSSRSCDVPKPWIRPDQLRRAWSDVCGPNLNR